MQQIPHTVLIIVMLTVLLNTINFAGGPTASQVRRIVDEQSLLS